MERMRGKPTGKIGTSGVEVGLSLLSLDHFSNFLGYLGSLLMIQTFLHWAPLLGQLLSNTNGPRPCVCYLS